MKIYDQCKLYGPYKRKDNRKHVILIWPDGRKQTVSYPKYLTEIRLGRYLKPNETIDHIDGDFTNNDQTNIQILDRSEHVTNDVRRCKSQKFICPTCSIEFVLSDRKLHDAIQNRKQKQSVGPFCSRSCAGKYGKYVQLTSNKLQCVPIVQEYYSLKNPN